MICELIFFFVNVFSTRPLKNDALCLYCVIINFNICKYVHNDTKKTDIIVYKISYLLHYNSFYKYFNSCYIFF